MKRDLLDDFQNEDFDRRPVDLDITDPIANALNETLLEEILHRSESLGGRYPFELEVHGEQWLLRPRGPLGTAALPAQVYICGLLVTAARYHIVADNSFATNKELSDQTQRIAALTAWALVAGEVYWFGWPRPDGADVLTAVTDLADKLGIPAESVRVPPWATAAEKDLGVDVVAWRQFTDNRPGFLFVVGQVASGASDWERKAVHQDAQHLRAWLGLEGPFQVTAAHFIPWVQNIVDVKPTGGMSHIRWSQAQGAAREIDLGVVVDRLRMTMLAPENSSEFPGSVSPVWLAEVVDWVHRTLEPVAATCATI
ncbi:MAG: hypothetical protein ACYC90_05000 [Candidatus Nanopelagicales bacterium]